MRFLKLRDAASILCGAIALAVATDGQFLPLPQFEAASIKASEPGNIRGSTFEFFPGAGLRVKNGTLKAIVETAYDIREFQISGGPGWVNSERYDILAKSPSNEFRSDVGNSPEDIQAIRFRLQGLLAQRFHLQVHREMKELPEYALEIAKNGPKLIGEDPNVPRNSATGIQTTCGQMIGTSATMANLVFMLSRQLNRPVLDHTALTGKYNFRLQWTPDAGPCPGTPDDTPSIFTALQEKLGLKLESMKGAVESLVIDHAEKPSEN
jgi:bla regulator protein blaR1